MGESTAKSVISGVLGVALLCFVVFKNYDSKKHVDAFNGYIEQVKPLLVKQDAVVDELKQVQDPEIGGKVGGWIERADAIVKDMEAIPIEDAEVQAMHATLVERSQLLSAALRSLEAGAKSKFEDKAKLDDYQKKCEQAGAKLNQFVKMRDAYFKKHDIKLKK